MSNKQPKHANNAGSQPVEQHNQSGDQNDATINTAGYDEASVRGAPAAGASDRGLEGRIDPRATDLGDDVARGAGNRGSTVGSGAARGMEAGIDAGLTDLGDDVNR